MKLTVVLLTAAIGASASPAPVDVDPRSADALVNRATPPQSEIDQWLKAHNDERAQHGAVALVWNQTLSDKAADWASQCIWEHSNSGQNLAAWFSTQANKPMNIPQGVGGWNDEEPNYNATTYSGAGHWTQVVWKSTTSVGCAAYSCPPGTLGRKPTDPWKTLWYYVCNYYRPGNVSPREKYYPINVQP
ncbi:fruiting body protein SC7 [Schizophyllum commune]